MEEDYEAIEEGKLAYPSLFPEDFIRPQLLSDISETNEVNEGKEEDE